MEKTLIIDGKSVRFKSAGGTPMRYKAQFGKDFLKEIMKMLPALEALEGATFDGVDDLDDNALDALNSEVLYNVAWVLAKTADNTIPGPIEWLDTFSRFPVVEMGPELLELIMSSMDTKKK